MFWTDYTSYFVKFESQQEALGDERTNYPCLFNQQIDRKLVTFITGCLSRHSHDDHVLNDASIIFSLVHDDDMSSEVRVIRASYFCCRYISGESLDMKERWWKFLKSTLLSQIPKYFTFVHFKCPIVSMALSKQSALTSWDFLHHYRQCWQTNFVPPFFLSSQRKLTLNQ